MGSTPPALLAIAALAFALLVLLGLLLQGARDDGGAVANSRAATMPDGARAQGAPEQIERLDPVAATLASPASASDAESPPSTAPALFGSLRVEVLDLNGAALEGLSVFVQRDARDSRERRSDASGSAHFAELEAGVWSLALGDQERPLVAANSIAIGADRAEFVRVQLSEPLTELDVEVVDEVGRPAPGVALQTRCERGGVSRAVTDHAGRARLRHVSLGVVRVFAKEERLGRGNRALEVAAGERPALAIVLATRESVR